MLTQSVRTTLGASVIAAGMTLSMSAFAAQGLYSADDLMDANVYDSNGEEIGEVEDLLLGDDMSLHSLIIETGSILGMGGREVVVMRGTFTVRSEQDGSDFDDIEYQVHLDSDKEGVKGLPEYDEGWWEQTKAALVHAWEETKDTSESAWESTKEATSSAWQSVREGAKELGDEVDDATD